MTRLDLTARELHGLIVPVLPHASTDAELAHLNTVHLQVRDTVLYAVATDRYTMAATRLPLHEPVEDLDVTLDRAEVAAALKLFGYTKDEDPHLVLTVDKFPVPVGNDRTIDGLGLRIDAEHGTRLTLHDHGAPDLNPFANWRAMIGAVVHRATVPAAPALILSPAMLPRWSKAARKGERLTVFVGPEPGDPLLFIAEDHFAGIWAPISHIDGAEAAALDDSPWRAELPAQAPADRPQITLDGEN